MGITQHAHGGDTVRAIANLGLLRECVGRAGHGPDADPRPLGRAGRRRDGRLRDRVPRRRCPIDADDRRDASRSCGASPCRRAPGLTTVGVARGGAARRARRPLLHRRQLPRDAAASPSASSARSARDPAAHPQRHRASRAQMLVEPADTVYLLPARTRYEQQGGGTETTTERRVIFSPVHPGPRRRRGAQRVGDAARLRARREAARATSRLALRERRRDPRRHRARRAGLRGDRGAREAGRPVPVGRAAAVRGPAASRPPTARRTSARCGRRRRRRRGAGGRRFLLATRRGKQFNSMVQRDRDPLTGAERDHVFIAPRGRRAPRPRARRPRCVLRSATRRVPRPRLRRRRRAGHAAGALAGGQRADPARPSSTPTAACPTTTRRSRSGEAVTRLTRLTPSPRTSAAPASRSRRAAGAAVAVDPEALTKCFCQNCDERRSSRRSSPLAPEAPRSP